MDIITVGAIASFLIILVALVIVRARGSKFEIKPSDMAAATLPVGLLLLAAGKIKVLEVGGVKIEAALKEAVAKPVHNEVKQVDRLPVEDVPTGAKGPVAALDRLRDRGAEALTFVLGAGGYEGNAIRRYIEELPSLRHLELHEANGALFGVLDAQRIRALLSGPRPQFEYSAIADALNNSNRDLMAKLPSFLPANRALKATVDRKDALKSMDELRVEDLPVIEENGEVAGYVSRSRLTARILLDMANATNG
jgi:hypothetical protein